MKNEKAWDISNMTTEALTEAINLITAYRDYGAPTDFYDNNVEINFNSFSGKVFFTNSDFQVAVYNDETGKLESWYITPDEWHEGILSDLLDEFDNGDITSFYDLEYLKDICEWNEMFDKVVEIENTMKSLREDS